MWPLGRVRAEQRTSLLRSARPLPPPPLPGGGGITTRFQSGTLLPPGEGGGSRMRVRAERCASLLRSARTPTPLSHRGYLRVAGGEGLSPLQRRTFQYENIFIRLSERPDRGPCQNFATQHSRSE